MKDKLRGQIRHLLGMLGSIVAISYVPETNQEVFSLQWEFGVGIIFILGAMFDSWRTKKNKDEGVEEEE